MKTNLYHRNRSRLIRITLTPTQTVDVDVSLPQTNPLRPPETRHFKYDLHAKMNDGATRRSTDAVKFDMITSAQQKGLAVVNAEPPQDEPQDGPFSEARMYGSDTPKMPTRITQNTQRNATCDDSPFKNTDE